MTTYSFCQLQAASGRTRKLAVALATTALLSTSCSQQTVDNRPKIDAAEAKVGSFPKLDQSLNTLLARIDSATFDTKKQELTEFTQPGGQTEAQYQANYVLARLLMKGSPDEIKQAIESFEKASGVQALQERCQWHIVECGNALADEKTVRKALQTILEKAADPSTRAHAQYALAQSYMNSNDEQRSQTALEATVKEAPDSKYALGAGFFLGQTWLKAEQSPKALALWRRYLKECPDGRFALDIIKYMNTLSLEPSDHGLFGNAYFAQGYWSQAIDEWDQSRETTHWYPHAQAQLRRGKAALAKDELLSGIKSHSKSTDVPDAAKLLSRLSSKDGAIAVWKVVQENCPDFEDAALYNLGLRAAEPQSLQYFKTLTTKYPNSEYASEARWWQAWNKIKQGQNAVVLPELKDAAEAYKDTRVGARFGFWVGKVLERTKQTQAAQSAYKRCIELHGHHYYGWRSAARLAALAGRKDRGWSLNLPAHLKIYDRLDVTKKDWTWPEPPQLVSYESLDRQCGPTIATLAQLRQWDECLELLEKDQCPDLRSICLAKADQPLEAINAMYKELKGPPDGTVHWQMGYPLLYARIISSEGALKKVDPLLAQALTREESRYNIHALSSSNAHGLMQLLPGTAMGVAKRLGVQISHIRDVHKPEINLKLGVDYLSYSLARSGGNAMVAVAGYNGGPNAAQAWVKRFTLADGDIFVESIPYTETRDYVRKVFGSYWNYEAVYGS